MSHIRFIVYLLFFTLMSSALRAEEASMAAKIADATQQAHGLHAWWGQEVLAADVQIIFGGKVILDGRFTFQAHGPKARFDRADGATVYFDGETAWIAPADAADNRGRFHVLTWPWFIMAPFKMQGEGIHLSDPQTVELDGTHYETLLQTFGSDMGDTPDDWYRFYLNPESKLVDAMSYIVTYGKDTETANQQASIIKYFDYKDVDGAKISTRYEFWFWDARSKSYKGDTPKGTGTVSNLKFLSSDEVDFTVPEEALELTMP